MKEPGGPPQSFPENTTRSPCPILEWGFHSLFPGACHCLTVSGTQQVCNKYQCHEWIKANRQLPFPPAHHQCRSQAARRHSNSARGLRVL